MKEQIPETRCRLAMEMGDDPRCVPEAKPCSLYRPRKMGKEERYCGNCCYFFVGTTEVEEEKRWIKKLTLKANLEVFEYKEGEGICAKCNKSILSDECWIVDVWGEEEEAEEPAWVGSFRLHKSCVDFVVEGGENGLLEGD